MAILTGPFCQFFYTDGETGDTLPLSFARVYFTDTETTTPRAVYRTYELDDVVDNEHPDPVVCDINGRMPAVYFDQNFPLRMRVVSSTGDLGTPLIDIDPVTQDISVGAAQIEDGAIEEKLGYTPLNPGGGIITGNMRVFFVPTTLNVDEVGFRGSPVFIVNVGTTLGLQHSGGFIYKDGTTAYTLTIPTNADVAWPIGHYVDVLNGNTNNITVARDSGVALYESGDATFADEDKTLTPGDKVRLIKLDTDSWAMLL